jgi:hypothetical protein
MSLRSVDKSAWPERSASTTVRRAGVRPGLRPRQRLALRIVDFVVVVEKNFELDLWLTVRMHRR